MGVYNTRLGYDRVPMAGTSVGSGPPPPDPGSAANTPTTGGEVRNRILWNRRGRDIDELVVSDIADVHVEQMDNRCWWIGITRVDGSYWSGNFICDSRGRMRFTEQGPPDGFQWDRDDTHELEAGGGLNG
jgi:hypothetical protein